MSDDANIIRVSFEEIQEFNHLDLYDITPPEGEKQILLVYDPDTRVFYTAEFDLNTGVINLTQQSTLSVNVTVATDDLPVERGYIFLKGQTLTDVLQNLVNPSFDAKVTLSANNGLTGVTSDSTLLVEVVASTQITFSSVYEKRQGGDIDAGSEVYYLDNVVKTNPFNISFGSLLSQTLKVGVNSLGNATFPAITVYDEMILKAIYPSFYGFSALNVLPIDFSSGTLLLDDISVDGSLELPIRGEVDDSYVWFAVHTDNLPINWIGKYINGTLQYSNEGLVSTNFNNKGVIIYRGNTYNVFMTKSSTLFEQDLIINF